MLQSRQKLSTNICKLKFMKKSREKAEKETLEEQRKVLFSNAITEDMRKAGSKYVTESSFIACENLRYGRMSFGGFNPEIERIMRESNKSKHEQSEENIGIPDDEFAARYSAVSESIAKKFAKKRSRPEIRDEANKLKSPKVTHVNEVKKDLTDKKQTNNSPTKEQVKDSLKLRYPKRKRAAEFWKPEVE